MNTSLKTRKSVNASIKRSQGKGDRAVKVNRFLVFNNDPMSPVKTTAFDSLDAAKAYVKERALDEAIACARVAGEQKVADLIKDLYYCGELNEAVAFGAREGFLDVDDLTLSLAQIERIEIPLTRDEVADSHKQFVTDWMKDAARELTQDLGLEPDDVELESIAAIAYETYCQGDGLTEYEAVESAVDEHCEADRLERS